MPMDPLPSPPRYFPPAAGRYETTPSLRALGTDFGNGVADGLVFQLDNQFHRYRDNKLTCRGQAREEYILQSGLDPVVARATVEWMARRLAAEHPGWFALTPTLDAHRLECRLTGEQLAFTCDWELIEGGPQGYADGLDALCCQVQEDIALLVAHPEQGNSLAYLHICAPSGWVPAEKIGRDFVTVHEPVPGIEPTLRAARGLVDAMVNRGPFVRFVWGIAGDNRLNRHPRHDLTDVATAGRPYRPDRDPPFWFRVERQVLWGLPHVRASVFAIRLLLRPGTEILANPAERVALHAALEGMSPESRRYKEFGDIEPLLRLLAPPPCA